MKKERQLNATRRDLLRGALGVSAVASVISQAAKRDPTLIKRANEKHRGTDWQLTKVRLDQQRGFRTSLIEGYCSHRSGTRPG
jgi:hypothetical protein